MSITEQPVVPASVLRERRAPRAAARPAADARPRDPRPGVSGVAPPELLGWFADRGQAAFRARQVADHVWSGRATSFEEIHTLPGALRADLEAPLPLRHARRDRDVARRTAG